MSEQTFLQMVILKTLDRISAAILRWKMSTGLLKDVRFYWLTHQRLWKAVIRLVQTSARRFAIYLADGGAGHRALRLAYIPLFPNEKHLSNFFPKRFALAIFCHVSFSDEIINLFNALVLHGIYFSAGLPVSIFVGSLGLLCHRWSILTIAAIRSAPLLGLSHSED